MGLFIIMFIHLLFASFIFFLVIAFITGAPFVPSFKNATNSMIKHANITPGMKIVDLGSGDGRLLMQAADNQAYATGYEINPYLVLFTKLRIAFSCKKKYINVVWKNMWNADVSSADVVFVYLLPWKMKTLQKKLEREMKKGALVVSNSFVFPEWTIIREDKPNHIYVFKL